MMKRSKLYPAKQSPSSPSTLSSNSTLSSSLLVCALSFLPYLSNINGDFVFDDSETVRNNPVVTGEVPLKEILWRDFWGKDLLSSTSHKSFRPITTLTFWLNFRLHGLSPLGYHLVSVCLHSLNSLLFLFLLRRLQSRWRPLSASISSFSLDIALPAAVAFAVHPIHTEAVANISCRAELLSGFFSLAAVWLFLKKDCPITYSIPSIVLYTMLVVLATFSKEQGITVLPICMVLCVLDSIGGGPSRRLTLSLLAVISLLLIWFRFHLNGYSNPAFSKLDNPAAFVEDPLLRLASFCQLWLIHLRLLILPLWLCFDYSMGCVPPVDSLQDPRLLALPTVILLMIGCVYGITRMPSEYKRVTSFAVLFGLISFFPASNLLVTVGFSVAERILYIPSMGYCILVGITYRILQTRAGMANAIGATVIGLAIMHSHQRSFEWNNELSLYTSGLAVCPNNAKIHYNLGKVLVDNGQSNAAEKNYLEAIRLNPSYEQALNNLANLLERRNRHQEAVDLLWRATRVAPAFATGWMNLGIALMHTGRWNESLLAFEHSLRLRPLSADCHFNLGNLYQRMEQKKRARDSWINATSLDPNHVAAWSNLLVVLDELGECPLVVALGPRALAAGPSTAAIHSQLGSCMAQLGDFEGAEKQLERAVQAAPNSAIHHANLGVLYQRWRRFEKAQAAYRNALRIDSAAEHIRDNLYTVERFTRNSTRQH